VFWAHWTPWTPTSALAALHWDCPLCHVRQLPMQRLSRRSRQVFAEALYRLCTALLDTPQYCTVVLSRSLLCTFCRLFTVQMDALEVAFDPRGWPTWRCRGAQRRATCSTSWWARSPRAGVPRSTRGAPLLRLPGARRPVPGRSSCAWGWARSGRPGRRDAALQ